MISILQNALFGEGVYLSGELSVSMPYAPTGTGWDQSLIGHMLSCIAVCEIIDDPSVKCQVKGQLHIYLISDNKLCLLLWYISTLMPKFVRSI